MNKKIKIIFDVALAAVVVVGSIYLCSKYIPKIGNAIDTSREKSRIAKELAAKELAEKIEEFNKSKTEFLDTYKDQDIAKATLSNKNVDSKEDKAYLYGKLKDARDKVIFCDHTMEKEFERSKQQFIELLASTKLDKDSLDAKIFSMREHDRIVTEKIKSELVAKEEALKHQRELEIIEEKKNKELAVYKAKLEAEQAKFKTVCETMKDAEKKVQANVNVKTDLEV